MEVLRGMKFEIENVIEKGANGWEGFRLIDGLSDTFFSALLMPLKILPNK